MEQIGENQQINKSGVERNVCVMALVAKEVVVHVAGVASLMGFVNAPCKKEDEQQNLTDGKECQQSVNMASGPKFGGSGEKHQRGDQEPKVAL